MEVREKEYPPAGPSMSHSARKSPAGSSGSVDSVGTRQVSVSVVSDTGTKVQLLLKAHGLKKKKGLIKQLVTMFKKPSTPSSLLSNGQFSNFELTAHGLHFTLDVQTDKKKKKGNGNRVDTFLIDIKRFPSSINPDSAEFEVLEPASGECFILLSLIKTDNLNVNWKDFLASNATIDVDAL